MAGRAGFSRTLEAQIVRTAALIGLALLLGCEADSVTTPLTPSQPPRKMQVAGDSYCFWEFVDDNFVCYAGTGAGFWDDSWGLEYGDAEVNFQDVAGWMDIYEQWEDEWHVSAGGMGLPWNAVPPTQFDPPWPGYRNTSWFAAWGNESANDQYVDSLSTPPPSRTLASWETALFTTEAQRMRDTVDPHQFCTNLGSNLLALLSRDDISAYDQRWLTPAPGGTQAEVRGVTNGGEGGTWTIYIYSRPSNYPGMRHTLRHEAAHVVGVAAVDGEDSFGQSNNPNAANYRDPLDPHYKGAIMRGNPWAMNGDHASAYCDFWADKSGA
ncbi:MAG: hypothetical protein M3Z17_11100 [Gemmatimonadota bacterium]|nr:hypothetical protein [Gemmatimonadota bacterium]